MAQVADTAEIQAGDRLARRNARILAAASALGSANASIVVATGGLVGQTIAPDPALATAPVTAFVSGTAVAAIPAALLMKRFGRRTGFMAGTLVGIVAGLLAALSVRRGLFPLFVLATFLAGFYGASCSNTASRLRIRPATPSARGPFPGCWRAGFWPASSGRRP